MRQVHYVFHKILSELGKIYYSENGQPFHEWKSIIKKKRIH
jgi:hypothetical protein